MWINVPILASAPAAVDSTSAWNWLWEAFAQSVGWSGKPSPSSTWQRRWKRAAWFKRLCGRICEPSMAERGVKSWIASLRATHASLSASPASVVEKTILGTFGRTSVESLAKWNRQSCFSKTCPAILASASRKSPAIFKQWVTQLRRASLLRRKSALATGESGFSLWRSPTSYQPGADVNKLTTKNGDTPTSADQRLYRNGLHRTVGLPQQTTLFHRTLWATPRAEERSQCNSRDSHVALSRQAPLWPTPNVPNGGRTVPEQQMQAGKSPSGRKVQKPLARTAELWRSPNARDYHPPGKHQNGQPDQLTLPEQARNESACLCSRLDPEKSKHGRESSKSTRRLNPRFVTWLMGWPRTDSGFSATEWSHYRQRMRSSLFGLLSTIRKPHD